jgi:hypothetical protein
MTGTAVAVHAGIALRQDAVTSKEQGGSDRCVGSS